MNRSVVLSDPLREFPNNNTSAFKVQLPSTVQLDGDWDVGLVSDRGLDLNELFMKDSNEVVRVQYHVKNVKSNTHVLRTENVKRQTLARNEGVNVDGVGFMKAMIDEINWQTTTTLEGVVDGVVEDTRRPTFHWEGEDVVLERKDLNVIGNNSGKNVDFRVEEVLALRMGWLEKSIGGTYKLGLNLKYSLYHKTAKKATKGPVTELAVGRLWIVESASLVLSFVLDWPFTNLNKAFQAAVKHTSRTLLVYSDVVDSNVVGDSEHPLIQEVHYNRDGGGNVYFELVHIQ